MNTTLRVRDIHYSYPDGREALAGVNLDVGQGERIAILGPNGAGKTTLAHHLNGIRRADEGLVEVDGIELDDSTIAAIRRKVGLVFQNPDDQLFMPTVEQDVGFGPANLGAAVEELPAIVADALAMVGASGLERRVPHHLSGGERRRIALATVLSMSPAILVLDEPTSGLDPGGRRDLIEVLSELEMAQVIITHDLPFALELCPRAVIMDGGQIVAEGKTTEILSDTELLGRHRLEMPYRLR